MDAASILVQIYGPVMNIDQVAEILKRTPGGLRFTLRGNCALATKLNPGRLKIGRRVLFKTLVVAAIIDSGV